MKICLICITTGNSLKIYIILYTYHREPYAVWYLFYHSGSAVLWCLLPLKDIKWQILIYFQHMHVPRTDLWDLYLLRYCTIILLILNIGSNQSMKFMKSYRHNDTTSTRGALQCSTLCMITSKILENNNKDVLGSLINQNFQTECMYCTSL